MVNINIYPIKSELTYGSIISRESKKLIEGLAKLTGYSFKLVGIDELYDGDLGLILVQSGGSETKFMEIFDKINGPFLLLTYGSSNSLAASLEILAYIKKKGKNGEILHGSEEYISDRLTNLISEKTKLLQEKSFRLGVIGRPSDWLIASDVDYLKAKKLFKVDLIDLTTQELIWLYASNSARLSDDRLKANYDKEELNKAYRVYKSLKQMVKDHRLDGLTIRCFDLLGSVKTTACLGLALLNEKGIVASCEGDIPSMLSCFVIKRILDLPSFQANPCYVDVNKNTVIFAHCTLPLNMAKTYEFNTHFESNIGVGIHGVMDKREVTVLKLDANLDKFFCAEGKLNENLYRKDLCRTQIEVGLNQPVSYFLNSPLGNHHLICYGHHKEELAKYLNGLGLEEVK